MLSQISILNYNVNEQKYCYFWRLDLFTTLLAHLPRRQPRLLGLQPRNSRRTLRVAKPRLLPSYNNRPF